MKIGILACGPMAEAMKRCAKTRKWSWSILPRLIPAIMKIWSCVSGIKNRFSVKRHLP